MTKTERVPIPLPGAASTLFNARKNLQSLNFRPFLVGKQHRLENRCVLRHISNMNIHSWAIWAARRSTEKNWADYEQLLGPGFFMFSWANFFFKHFSVRTKKLHSIEVKTN